METFTLARAKSTPTFGKFPAHRLFQLPARPLIDQCRSQSFSPYAFAFSPDFTIAYLADDTLKGIGGMQRWDLKGSWAMTYAFNSLTNIGARGVAVDFSGTQPVIFATTAENSTNRLVSIVDTGAASPATTLATAGVNQIFRGVTFAPYAAKNPSMFGALQNTNGLVITWTTLLNRNYTVQWAGDLASTNWTTLTNLTSTSFTTTVVDSGAPASTNRFYRIELNRASREFLQMVLTIRGGERFGIHAA